MSNQELEKRGPSPVDRLKTVLASPSVEQQFRNALGDSASLFMASLIDIYTGDKSLQECNPNAIAMQALKAATLKLPINKSLGFAYIVPYDGQPQMQIGYKGFIQLAIRTGQYRHIHADIVYDGELQRVDKLTGEPDLNGVAKSTEVIGAFAHLETVNGFLKTVFWSLDRINAHAKRFSKSFVSGKKKTPWITDPDAMRIKTVLKALLSKYGIMSVEMISAFGADEEDRTPEAQLEDAVEEALENGALVDIEIRENSDAIPEEPDF